MQPWCCRQIMPPGPSNTAIFRGGTPKRGCGLIKARKKEGSILHILQVSTSWGARARDHFFDLHVDTMKVIEDSLLGAYLSAFLDSTMFRDLKGHQMDTRLPQLEKHANEKAHKTVYSLGFWAPQRIKRHSKRT